MEIGVEFDGAERAATPVIGIVLLVAITVVIGAVVAGFVFDLGRSGTQSMPSTQLDVADASDILESDSTDEAFTLSHVSGDDVDTDNLLVVVETEDGTEITRDTLKTFGTTGSTFSAALSDGTDIQNVDTLETSDTVVVSENDADELTSEESYTITVIHDPSDGILLDTTVKLD